MAEPSFSWFSTFFSCTMTTFYSCVPNFVLLQMVAPLCFVLILQHFFRLLSLKCPTLSSLQSCPQCMTTIQKHGPFPLVSNGFDSENAEPFTLTFTSVSLRRFLRILSVLNTYYETLKFPITFFR